MTNIRLIANRNRIGFKADGHAEDRYACGKISIMCQAMAEAILARAPVESVNGYTEGTGKTEIIADISGISEAEYRELLTILGVGQIGFSIIQVQFPGSLDIAFENSAEG